MKSILAVLFTAVLAVSVSAQETKTDAPSSVTNTPATLVLMLPASAAMLTAPFVLTNGIISQADTMDLSDGGKAVFNFTITNAGDYLICAVVNAPDEGSNSVYVNVDAPPEDPAMIWDIEVNDGFMERTVSWRGKGDADSDEIVPKFFHLTAGAHKLIIIGRETTQLKSVSIKLAAK